MQQRRQFTRTVGDREGLWNGRKAKWRNACDLLVAEREFLIEIRISDRPKLVDTRNREASFYSGCCEERVP